MTDHQNEPDWTIRLQRQLVQITARAGVISGGHDHHLPFFFQPTVLTDVAADRRIMRDEPFAPVAPITTFGSLEHALEIANATEFGLASYVWTRDLRTAFLASEGIEAGMVGVNNMAVATAEAPFGGVKHSGYGREGGAEGVLGYTVVKTTHITL